MINYQFFPRSQGITGRISEIIDCFEKVDNSKNIDQHLESNEMLTMLRQNLEAIGFNVESGKSANEQIAVPVLFGENNNVDKSFAADALSNNHKIVIEAEAGRAVFSNQFLKDIFQACMTFEVENLVIAVLNEYKFKVKGQERSSNDFQSIEIFFRNTLYQQPITTSAQRNSVNRLLNFR